jgi:hypothetical protein
MRVPRLWRIGVDTLARRTVLVSLLAGYSALYSICSQATPPTLDERVAELIGQTLNSATEQQAFSDLETLGCPAVPAIIARMDDRQLLPDPRISLRNNWPTAFEGLRHYGPQKVVDALAAILNQLTGQDFGLIYNGGSDAARTDAIRGWRAFLRNTPPEKLCDGTRTP